MLHGDAHFVPFLFEGFQIFVRIELRRGELKELHQYGPLTSNLLMDKDILIHKDNPQWVNEPLQCVFRRGTQHWEILFIK